MAKLIYKGQDGQKKHIPLPSKAGFTANIIWLAPASIGAASKLKEKLSADMRKAKVKDLMPDDDNLLLMDLDETYRLGFIIQPQNEAKNESKSSRWRRQTLLFYRGHREWLVVAKDGTRIVVDKQQIPLMKIVHHGMDIQAGEVQFSFYDVTSQTVDSGLLKKIGRKKKCPFCQDPFLIDEQIIQCPSCNTVQHAECWEEYGDRCSGPPGCRYGTQPRHAFTVRESTTS